MPLNVINEQQLDNKHHECTEATDLSSEKMMAVHNERPGSKYNQYAFKVDIKATKQQIKT
jgi:ribosomal protein L23